MPENSSGKHRHRFLSALRRNIDKLDRRARLSMNVVRGIGGALTVQIGRAHV